MNSMSLTIIPKSDQLNSDSLISGPRTIRITRVEIAPGTEQPVTLHYEGDEGQPYKPCKSMRRVLVGAWGLDGNGYVGRAMTLYRDDKVQFGGLAVGGIRISHMSHIKGALTMALTATRGNKKAFTVKPLVEDAPPPDATVLMAEAERAADQGLPAYQAFWLGLGKVGQAVLLSRHEELKARAGGVVVDTSRASDT